MTNMYVFLILHRQHGSAEGSAATQQGRPTEAPPPPEATIFTRLQSFLWNEHSHLLKSASDWKRHLFLLLTTHWPKHNCWTPGMPPMCPEPENNWAWRAHRVSITDSFLLKPSEAGPFTWVFLCSNTMLTSAIWIISKWFCIYTWLRQGPWD